MITKKEMLKKALTLGKISQSPKVRGLRALKWLFQKVSKTNIKMFTRWVRGLSNSCNPQPAQKKFMLKNVRVFRKISQTALKTPQTPQIGSSTHEC